MNNAQNQRPQYGGGVREVQKVGIDSMTFESEMEGRETRPGSVWSFILRLIVRVSDP